MMVVSRGLHHGAHPSLQRQLASLLSQFQSRAHHSPSCGSHRAAGTASGFPATPSWPASARGCSVACMCVRASCELLCTLRPSCDRVGHHQFAGLQYLPNTHPRTKPTPQQPKAASPQQRLCSHLRVGPQNATCQQPRQHNAAEIGRQVGRSG